MEPPHVTPTGHIPFAELDALLDAGGADHASAGGAGERDDAETVRAEAGEAIDAQILAGLVSP